MTDQKCTKVTTACALARTWCHKYDGGRCIDADAPCLVLADVPCWYFEKAVLPLATRRRECAGCDWDYAEKITGWQQRIEQPEHLRCRAIRHAAEWRAFLKSVGKESLWEWAPSHRYLGPLAKKGKRGTPVPTGAPTAGRPPAIGTEHPGFRMCSSCGQGFVKAAADEDDVCPTCLPSVQAERGRPKRKTPKDTRFCACGTPLSPRKRCCETCRRQRRRAHERNKKRQQREGGGVLSPT